MWPSSTTLRMSPSARAVLTSPSTITRSFQSESTETNSTPTFTSGRRSLESASFSHTTTTTITTIKVVQPRAVEVPSNSSVSSERPCHILGKRSKKCLNESKRSCTLHHSATNLKLNNHRLCLVIKLRNSITKLALERRETLQSSPRDKKKTACCI